MDYSVKNIVKSKPGNFVGLIITLGGTLYFLLAYLQMVDASWLTDLVNPSADVKQFYLPLTVIFGLALVISLIITISDVAAASKIKKNLAEYSEDDVLDQMNNHAVYVFEDGKTPRFFVTEKYIVAYNMFICCSKDVSMIYTSHYKQNTYFMLKLRNNKELNAGGSIAMRKKLKECTDAMRKVCPGLLVGDTKENREEHKARVKLAKEQD